MTDGEHSLEPKRELLLETRGLTRSFGSRVAVDQLSFALAKGELWGLLGENGAGKTTTLRMLAGSLGPTSGTLRIQGLDPETEPTRARERIGYMPEAPPLYPELTTEEYLAYRAALKRPELRGAARKQALALAAERAGLSSVKKRLLGELSKGYRQRVALADALYGEPPILILDEPTAGMDPRQVEEVHHLLRELSCERLILLSSHVLSEVESLCTHALVLVSGRLVQSGSLRELREATRKGRLALRLQGTEAALRQLLQTLEEKGARPEVLRAGPADAEVPLYSGSCELELDPTPHLSLTDTLALALSLGLTVEGAGPRPTPLREVFERFASAPLAQKETSL